MSLLPCLEKTLRRARIGWLQQWRRSKHLYSSFLLVLNSHTSTPGGPNFSEGMRVMSICGRRFSSSGSLFERRRHAIRVSDITRIRRHNPPATTTMSIHVWMRRGGSSSSMSTPVASWYGSSKWDRSICSIELSSCSQREPTRDKTERVYTSL